MIEVDATVFFQCPKNSWILGTVEAWDGQVASCRPADPRRDGRDLVPKLSERQLFVARDDVVGEEVDDLLNLTVLHDATLLNCLRRRYLKDVIYTNIGAIAVALNPFNYDIPWYKDDQMVQYLEEGDTVEKSLPHSWAVAHNTFYEMRNSNENQTVLVSGESGAGKTEASKIVMRYLGAVSCKAGSEAQKERGRAVGHRIHQTSPALEAFGNAKTVRNDNSSRFGKFMQVKFDPDGFLVGAFVTKYLLEKSRIVTAAQNERVYHAFYLVARGYDSSTYAVENASDFKVLTSGNCLTNKEFDSAAEYQEVCAALRSIGIPDTEIFSMFATVAAVLHLGNVAFAADGEGSVVGDPASVSSLEKAAQLLQVDGSVLRNELTTTTLTVAGQPVVKVLNPTAAADVKEALMKSLYDGEFRWLVERCNAMLDVPEHDGNWIGLLDIFGFEDFTVNSFEQLCINLTNETLQGHYNEYIFNRDLDECRAEGIDMSNVEFPDNTACIEMITNKKNGILSLLDEECSLGKGSDLSFLEKITTACGGVPFFVRKTLQKDSFTVQHYAGDVTYTVHGWLDKNRDTLKDALRTLCRASTDTIVAQLLPAPTENERRVTVGGFFKTQLKELMEVLNSTNPHWIRCIKPHPAKKPLMWHGVNVMNQLSSSGVLGTVKIRKAGYPVRVKLDEFRARYSILGKTVEEILSTARLLGPAGSGGAQIGTQRVFLKAEAYVTVERCKKNALAEHATVTQAFFSALAAHLKGVAAGRSSNQMVMEQYRPLARARLAMQTEESVERQLLFERALSSRVGLKEKYDETFKELYKEARRMQVERIRAEHERREREKAAEAQRRKVEEKRRLAQQRILEERQREQQELLDLEQRTADARAERGQRQLDRARRLQEMLRKQLEDKADQAHLQRLRRQAEDKAKAEAAKSRRTQMEEVAMERARRMHLETEVMQRRGELLKMRRTFETKQARDEAKLAEELRRREITQRLAADEEERHQDRMLQLTLADARFEFHKATRKHVDKDNSQRTRVNLLDKDARDREVALLREAHQRRDRAVTKQVRGTLEASHRDFVSFQSKAEQTKQQRERFLDPTARVAMMRAGAGSGSAATRRGTSPAAGASRRHTQQLYTLRRDIIQSGSTACEQVMGRNHPADTARVRVDRPQPTPIDAGLYERLNRNEDRSTDAYVTAVMADRPLFDLPWRR